MRLNWIKDQVSQKQFYIYWDKGTNNMADYSTKHFAPSYHQRIRPSYILKGYSMIPTDMWARVCSYSPFFSPQWEYKTNTHMTGNVHKCAHKCAHIL